MSADVLDSPDRSVAEHVRRYVATDGRDGYLEGGVPKLVLTVTGRTSGRPRSGVPRVRGAQPADDPGGGAGAHLEWGA